MDRVHRHFSRFPSQEAVATLMLRRGFRVSSGNAYSGDVKVADTAIAKATGVDRRVVRSAIERISETPELLSLYSKLDSMLLLSEASKEIGCSVIEIVPTDATVPGIMAGIMDVLYRAGINVRQAVVSDPLNARDSHLIIVADGEIQGPVTSAVRNSRGVASVIIRRSPPPVPVAFYLMRASPGRGGRRRIPLPSREPPPAGYPLRIVSEMPAIRGILRRRGWWTRTRGRPSHSSAPPP
ncbi:hypothetical protein PAA26_05835 [Methanomassiliicoccaceae archaeon COG_1]|nr:hypothetical protein [Methanomassiliicoccaceae archaeon COG_1]